MTPQERQAALEINREITDSALRFERTRFRTGITEAAVSLTAWTAAAVTAIWLRWPWAAIPAAAVSLAAVTARVTVQRRALARHRERCRELGVDLLD